MTRNDSVSGQPYSPPAEQPFMEAHGNPRLQTPYSGGGDGGGVPLRSRPSRLHTVFHIVEIVLLTTCTAILLFFTVKYVQVVNAVQDFGDQFGNGVSVPSPEPAPPICYIDPTDDSCPPGFDPNSGG